MTHRFTLALLIVCLIAPMTVLAQKKDSGRYTTIPKSTETVELPDGRTLQRMHFTQVTFADDPGSPFHNLQGDCTGTVVVSKAGEPIAFSGYCFKFDADGDGYWFWYRMDEAGTPQCPDMCGSHGTYNSYGKFKSFEEGSGTWRRVATFPDGTGMGTWEATYEMK